MYAIKNKAVSLRTPYTEHINPIHTNMDSNLGFIIVRHVSRHEQNMYWKECYKCIRMLYNNKIIIIDNGSDKDYLQNDLQLTNTEIVQSEFKSAGEIMGYYYFHKLKPFTRAVILHDTMFIKKYIDFTTSTMRFFWHFPPYINPTSCDENLFLRLNYHEELLNLYTSANGWVGCMGSASVIDIDFLVGIVEKYNLFNVIPYMSIKPHREVIERLLAIVCIREDPSIATSSILGDVFDYYGDRNFNMLSYGYSQYLNETRHMPIIKVWTNRPPT